MARTRTDSGTTIVETGVKHTSAAHVMAGDEPLTLIWSTIAAVCSDYLRGDITSLGPLYQPADKPPAVWRSSNSSYSAWYPIVGAQCGRCGQLIAPWAAAHDGHLEGDELTEAAREIAELADQEREAQRTKLIAYLADEVEDVASQLADGALELDELPDVRAMDRPGVGVDGDEIVAWGFLPALDGGLDDEIVEVTRPLPTTSTPS